jgi:hypothetical protein
MPDLSRIWPDGISPRTGRRDRPGVLHGKSGGISSQVEVARQPGYALKNGCFTKQRFGCLEAEEVRRCVS